MDNFFDRRFPAGATVNRRTGEVELQYQTGDDQPFAAVLLPLLRVGQMVLETENGGQGDKPE